MSPQTREWMIAQSRATHEPITFGAPGRTSADVLALVAETLSQHGFSTEHLGGAHRLRICAKRRTRTRNANALPDRGRRSMTDRVIPVLAGTSSAQRPEVSRRTECTTFRRPA